MLCVDQNENGMDTIIVDCVVVRHNEIFMSAVNVTEQICALGTIMQDAVSLVCPLTRTEWGQYEIFMLLTFWRVIRLFILFFH